MNCRISRFLNKTIEIQKAGLARVGITFHDDLTQNADFLHAAMLFEVGDTARFMAANSLEETYSVNLIRPVRRRASTPLARC